MNKTLKVLPIILAGIITLLLVSIPVMAMTTKNDKTEKAVVKTESAQLDDSVRSVDTTTVKDTETVAVEEEKADNSTGMKAIAAAIVVPIWHLYLLSPFEINLASAFSRASFKILNSE